ncbi:hypothetical protein Tco_1331781, partial [Tanacetum coccineum]
MDGMEFNKDPIPFARIITTLVEFIKNDQPEDTSRISEVDDGEKYSKALMLIESRKASNTKAKSNNAHGSGKA